MLTALAPGNGTTAGGSVLSIFGINFATNALDPVGHVTIAGKACTILTRKDSLITCSTPVGM